MKIFIAIFAGIISGLFGAGGGLILVPALNHVFKINEIQSRATTIFCICPMVLTTGIFYYNNNLINWDIAIKCAVGGIIGACIGSVLLKKLSNKALRITYILFLSFCAFRFLVQ